MPAAWSSTPGGPPGKGEALRPAVRRAALTTYFHGMTDEIADAEVGREGIPYLLELLADPAFPRRDNVVAFLIHLPGVTAAPGLLDCLARPPVSPAIPEEDRALLLIPLALGHLAGQGDATALATLMDMTGPARPGSLLSQALAEGRYTAAYTNDLVEQAALGLAASGLPEARARLEQLRSTLDGSTGLGRAVGVALGSERPPPSVPTPSVSAAESRAADTTTAAHEHGLTFANHVSLPSPMTASRLDVILGEATLLTGTADFPEDIACCIRVRRAGPALAFGSTGDGLDRIDDANELTTVLNLFLARVKVVRSISHCGGPGTNIIGCGETPGNGIAVVRFTTAEGTLWLHEYGHNTGLGHNSDARYVMHGSLSAALNGMTQAECNSFHFPSANTVALITDLGTCHDDDMDDLATTVDNCPDDANPGQADLDLDGIGDVCDDCTDVDQDGYGTGGSPTCPAGAVVDCDDMNAAVFPGALDLCDATDNDCNGQVDETLCSAFDVTGDSEARGEELAWIGRAFTECDGPPSTLWWAGVDYDGDGCVDGQDLSVLSAIWGCDLGGTVCDVP